jgi:phosphate transport system substrate-binding protein
MSFAKKSVALTVSALTFGVAALAGQQAAFSDINASKADHSFVVAQAVPIKGKVQLSGAGATFPAPLYQNWFMLLNRKSPNIQVNYQAVGSGAGVKQFIAHTVDFGASDVAMSDAELGQVPEGALMLPLTGGEIVLAYNLPGVSKLKLSQNTYVGMFIGAITNWNDPKIAKENPGVALPNLPITIVHRSDGSGTTAVFTANLSAMSSTWKAKVGAGKTVQWPTGNFVGAKGNDGVTATIKGAPGSIGYIEYGYAKNNHIPFAALGNKAGKFVEANAKTGADTLASVVLPADLRAFVINPSGAAAYPFVTYTWLLVYKQYKDANKATAVKAVVDYAINDGQKMSDSLGYIPLPKNVRDKVAAAANSIAPSSSYKVTAK